MLTVYPTVLKVLSDLIVFWWGLGSGAITYYRAIVTKTCNIVHLIFDKVTQKHTMEKRQPLQQMVLGKLSASRTLKLDPCLSLCTSINSKWIKDLNIRLKPCRY
jgi:hypothetical protein